MSFILIRALDKNAALKATSWGKFQILGSNHLSAGYKDVNEFVSSLSVSEKNHLKAFVNFIKLIIDCSKLFEQRIG